MRGVAVGLLLVLEAAGAQSFAAHAPVVDQRNEPTWLPLLVRGERGVDLRYLVEPTPDGFQVSFKNFGTTPVHFGFYLGGLQEADAAISLGRIHLKPGRQSTTGIKADPRAAFESVRLVDVRAGEDEGAFLD